MANTRSANTGSTLYGENSKNTTNVALATNIIIKVAGGTAIGAIKSITINETREVKPIDEIGTDGHIDSCPTRSADISGSCSRIRFDGLRAAEAFNRGFIHPKSQAYPFDIVILDKNRKDPANHITTVIKNVWITSMSVTISADDWIISEEMNWTAEDIYSFRGVANPVANGGVNGITPVVLDIEQNADMGVNGKRGALDAQGLIDLDTGSLH